MGNKKWLWIVLVLALIAAVGWLLWSGKNTGNTGETSQTEASQTETSEAAESAADDNADSNAANVESSEVAETAENSEGSEQAPGECVVTRAAETEEILVVRTPLTKDVVTYQDASGELTKEEAATKLLSGLLDSLNDIPSQRRSYDMNMYVLAEPEFLDDAAAQELLEKITAESMTGQDGSVIELNENTWIFKDSFTFDFDGGVWYVEDDEVEDKGLLAENEQVKLVSDGTPTFGCFLLQKDGDTWRFQTLEGAVEDAMAAEGNGDAAEGTTEGAGQADAGTALEPISEDDYWLLIEFVQFQIWEFETDNEGSCVGVNTCRRSTAADLAALGITPEEDTENTYATITGAVWNRDGNEDAPYVEGRLYLWIYQQLEEDGDWVEQAKGEVVTE